MQKTSSKHTANSADVIVIGAGVVGAAIAHELSRFSLSVLVLEKHHDVAEGISKANSGVLHAGFMVPTGSLKARLNVEGLRHFPSLTEKLGVPYVNCKKLVIAQNQRELAHLKKLLAQGQANGVSGLSLIGEEQIRTLQPSVIAKYALFSEQTAVVLSYLLAVGKYKHK